MNILFLTVSAGAGHMKAAEVIKEYIELNNQDSKLHIVDTYRYVSPIIDKLVIGSYLSTLKNSPRLWGKLYELAEKGENVNDLSKTINKILSFKIKRFIKNYHPDVIVCTHPFPMQMVCNMKKKNQIDVPIVTVITDYASHTFWINEHVDAYIVANEQVADEMAERNVPADKIFPLGIPVSKSFNEKRNRNEILKEFGLEDKKTYLLMGGSLGFGEIKSAFLNLIESQKDFQLVVVCGKNEKLKNQLEKAYMNSFSQKKVRILGFTSKMRDLMDISDIIITKPGGLTVTESIIKQLPIGIISPIPGQEEKNSQFLLNNGIGIMIDEMENIDRLISNCIDNPLRVKYIKEMCNYLAKPDSVENIVNILKILSERIAVCN